MQGNHGGLGRGALHHAGQDAARAAFVELGDAGGGGGLAVVLPEDRGDDLLDQRGAEVGRLGERADKFRMMQRALKEAGIERSVAALALFERGPRKEALVGKVVGVGMVDEITDRTWVVIDAVDGRVHYAELGRLGPDGVPVRGAIVALGSGVLGGQTPPCVLGGNLCAFQWVDSTAQQFVFRFDQQGSVMNRNAFNFIQANVAGTILTFYSSGARCTEVNEWAWYWSPNVPPNLPGFPVADIPWALVLGAPTQNALIAGTNGLGSIGYDETVGNFNHGRQWSCINGASIVRMLDSIASGNQFYIDLYRGTPNQMPQNYFNSITINGQTLFTSSATYTATSANQSRWLWNVDVGLVSGNSYQFSWN